MIVLRRVFLRMVDARMTRRMLRSFTRRGAILAYHNVLPDGIAVPAMHVSATRLHEQLSRLTDEATCFVSLEEFLTRSQAGRTLAGCVAVTFDDAYRGTALALPVLRSLGIPATLFVPTGAIALGEPFWWDALECGWRPGSGASDEAGTEGAAAKLRRIMLGIHAGRCPTEARAAMREAASILPPWYLPMSWDEIRDWLGWEGAACAPHTVTHPVLPRLDRALQREEILESYETLLRECRRVFPVLAYPFGLYDRETIAAARECGLRAAVTMDRFGTGAGEDNVHRIPRIPAGRDLPPERLSLYLSGAWRSLRRSRDWVGGVPRLP